VKVHQEYPHAILFRDLVERRDISHPRAVVDLAHRLIDNTAALYFISGLTGSLKSLDRKAPKGRRYRTTWRGSRIPYFLFSTRLFDVSLERNRRLELRYGEEFVIEERPKMA